MKFHIELCSTIIKKQLLYLEEECSFYMNYKNEKVHFELIINKISLGVFDNQIIAVGGFCGLSKEMKAKIQVPEYINGSLKVESNLEIGLSHEINSNLNYEYPVYISIETGWVCIGNPFIKKKAVEFIKNCVVVIDDDGLFVSLWLKPESLPENL